MDHLPSSYYLRQKIRQTLAQHFEGYGYQGMELPLLELVDLHLRKTGQGVRRWLYLLQDRQGAELCLRPEITASVARALLDHEAPPLPLRVHYQGAVFRQGQTPAQMTQVGVELIGLAGDQAEAECIHLAYTGLEQLGMQGVDLVLNTMGVVIAMAEQWIIDPRYQDLVIESYGNLGQQQEVATVKDLRTRLLDLGVLEELPEHQQQFVRLLSRLGTEESQVLLTGVLDLLQVPVDGLRPLDEVVERLVTKLNRTAHQEGIQRFIEAAGALAQIQGPMATALEQLRDFLQTHGLDPAPYTNLQALYQDLIQSGIPVEALRLDLGFGRALHYYSGLIFELRHEGIVLGGGGRYDGLLRSLGGPDCPTVGFSYDLERLGKTLMPRHVPHWQIPHFTQVAIQTTVYGLGVRLARQLRGHGIRTQVLTAQESVFPEGALGIVVTKDEARILDLLRPVTVSLDELVSELLRRFS